MLAPLDNGTIFKKAFTDKTVFKSFVKDILGIDVEVGKIETEKKFDPKIGYIDFTLDIFAETVDHRVIIEIQRVDYDYNFDRFLHYFMMAIAQLQKGSGGYNIERTVYSIIVLTAPYKIDQKNKKTIRDEVMVVSVDPRNLDDKVVEIYGHKLVFLNHYYRKKNTPVNYLDWLDLIYESIHNPEDYHVNLNHKGIKKAVELIGYDKLSPEQRRRMKIDAQRKVVRKLDEDKAREEGREEGSKEKAIEMAKKLKEKGIDIALISETSGLSKEEIEKL